MPEDREELMRAVKEGRRVSKQSTARAFGIGSSWQVWRADFKMKLLDNTDSETGRKVQIRGTPSYGSATGKDLEHTD